MNSQINWTLCYNGINDDLRIMSFDFSSAFNAIQPRLLGDNLQVAGVDDHLTT